ncbi:MAG: hypothetical protein A2016_06895 [Elusimicrobia bacterium GWF2_62_30]|nr:MAG: hypothetical protein A2016_06895 [Elusimicrobia bacterium GWF2_62_30]
MQECGKNLRSYQLVHKIFYIRFPFQHFRSGVVQAAVAYDHYGDIGGLLFLKCAQDFDAAELWQHQVEQYQPGAQEPGFVEGLFPIGCLCNFKTLLAHYIIKPVQYRFVIINDEY